MVYAFIRQPSPAEDLRQEIILVALNFGDSDQTAVLALDLPLSGVYRAVDVLNTEPYADVHGGEASYAIELAPAEGVVLLLSPLGSE